MIEQGLSRIHIAKLQQVCENTESTTNLLLRSTTPRQYAEVAQQFVAINEQLLSLLAELRLIYQSGGPRRFAAGGRN